MSSLAGAAARGAVAGVVGTLAMDLVWFARFKRGDGEGGFAAWELTSEIEDWEQAPAPAQVGRKLLEGVTGRDVPVARAGTVNTVMHWAYGTAWTAQYGALTAVLGRRRPWWRGPAFGAAVWASDYVTLPLLGVYQPIWRYDVATLWQDLSAHLVFGTAADAALRALSR